MHFLVTKNPSLLIKSRGNYFSLLATFTNIPISIMLVKFFDFGTEGIAYGTISALMLFIFFLPINLKRIVEYSCTNPLVKN